MAARQFSNVAVETTLSSGIAGGAASLTVVSATGWPAAPFILVIEPDLANEELILVGAKAGAVFSSLTRGFGGTSDVGHSAGDEIKHVIVGEDLALTYTHIHKPGTDDTAAVTHADLAGIGTDDHHAQAHTVLSHSDTPFAAIRTERITSVFPLVLDTWTTIIFNSVVDEDDAGSDISHATGTGIMTLEAGWWHLVACAEFQNEDLASDSRGLRIRRGTDVLAIIEIDTPSDQLDNFALSLSTIVRNPSSTAFDAQAVFSGGTAEDLTFSGRATNFSAFKIRPL